MLQFMNNFELIVNGNNSPLPFTLNWDCTTRSHSLLLLLFYIARIKLWAGGQGFQLQEGQNKVSIQSL